MPLPGPRPAVITMSPDIASSRQKEFVVIEAVICSRGTWPKLGSSFNPMMLFSTCVVQHALYIEANFLGDISLPILGPGWEVECIGKGECCDLKNLLISKLRINK